MAGILVIFISLVADKIQQHYAIDLEAHAYFSKPVAASSVSQAIAEKLPDK